MIGRRIRMKEDRSMAYQIALIPGDGIGKDVIPQGVRVMEALASRCGFQIACTELSYSCDYYLQTGILLPADGIEKSRRFDAIYLGAVGNPLVPDHVSLWYLLIPIRRQMQQYVNVRPVRLLPGVQSPLANRKAADIDFIVVRENNEGEYSEIGGRLHTGTDLEMVIQESVFARKGVDRALRYAFDLAQSRPKKN